MALERETIEKRDFPVGRRGYDPAAVDAHLLAIADEVDKLKRSKRQRGETLAVTASDQVKAIIDAAETSGAEIRRQAEEEAREIRAEANRISQRERDEASAQARANLGRVSDSSSQLLKRLEAMEAELGILSESLRTGAGRLTAELELVESQMNDLSSFASAAAAGARAAEQEPPAMAESQAEVLVEEEAVVVAAEPAVEAEPPLQAEAEAPAEPEPLGEEREPAEAANGEDTEGARLIALNMALNGTPRDETDRYLAENFEIPNRGQLLDEVYASVEG